MKVYLSAVEFNRLVDALVTAVDETLSQTTGVQDGWIGKDDETLELHQDLIRDSIAQVLTDAGFEQDTEV